MKVFLLHQSPASWQFFHPLHTQMAQQQLVGFSHIHCHSPCRWLELVQPVVAMAWGWGAQHWLSSVFFTAFLTMSNSTNTFHLLQSIDGSFGNVETAIFCPKSRTMDSNNDGHQCFSQEHCWWCPCNFSFEAIPGPEGLEVCFSIVPFIVKSKTQVLPLVLCFAFSQVLRMSAAKKILFCWRRRLILRQGQVFHFQGGNRPF